MNTDFPEQLFKPDNQLIYNYKLEQGEQICKNKSILFCGIARDTGFILDRNIQCLHRTGKLFKDHSIFIYENDSTDNTIDILNKNKSNKLSFISEKREDQNYRIKLDNGEDPWHFNRCSILAECRNKYLEYIENLETKFDYICILDFDLKGGWSYEGIMHSIFTLEHDKKYGCVSAYGVLADGLGNDTLEQHPIKDYLMYDSFVFRPKNWNKGLHILSTPLFNGICVKRGDEPIEVDSNFGGMAIYKSECLKDKRYEAMQWADGYVDPDHTVMNRKLLKEGWKIIFNPSMIVSYSYHAYSMASDSKNKLQVENA
jgi:hypothetical protein